MNNNAMKARVFELGWEYMTLRGLSPAALRKCNGIIGSGAPLPDTAAE